MILDYQVLFVSDRFTRPLYNRKITYHFEFVSIQICHGFVKIVEFGLLYSLLLALVFLIKDEVRSGRPKVMTPRQDRYITLTHLHNRFKTAKSTSIQFGISRQTVLNPLCKNADPIRARRPYVGHIIRPHNHNLQLLWAQRHLLWSQAQWARVLFTDESRFYLSFADGRICVFRC